MIKIPLGTITISKDKYALFICDSDTIRDEDDTFTLGRCDFVKSEILFRDGLQKSVLYNTVIHELTHAYAYSYGVHFHGEEECNTEERVCDFMGTHLPDIYEDSRKVFAVISEKYNFLTLEDM